MCFKCLNGLGIPVEGEEYVGTNMIYKMEDEHNPEEDEV